ncbi:hypothetical protein F4820DRAFT_448612 [Hypoxylon rubiginosum]|uniref:Uncharacterized protein n=1 Tax=Hypoxylon rubiginosum TaxID=110542 RepID=A0ACB9Z1I6_9PEZI|nr:hypothetical protein F4820DRAFT_448612 [Hypoxylon rubiginosum]
MASSDGESGDGLKVIHAGLFRMGTWSMAKAYRILDFKTFHGLDEPTRKDWCLLEEAAEATWPSAPEARPRPPFTRSDWDEIWGNEYDAVCDTAAPFTLELFKAYPDAKVVLVQRDYDTWWPSFQTEVIDKLFTPFFDLSIFLAWHLVGYRAGHAMRKLVFGFFDAKTKEEIGAHGRETYDRFFREIRATVPPERLLEYKMGSGWEPLCGFLGKDVPDAPFPFSNDQKAHSEGVEAKQRKLYLAMSRNAVLGVMGLAAVGASWWGFFWN